MSVLLETSLGDITVDLLVDDAPKCCENFIKLCKVKYYNYSPVYNVQPNFSFQTGDPIGPGSEESDGGRSIWSLLGGAKTFLPEINPKLKHVERGTVSMATVPARNTDHREASSQFIITLGENLDQLDGKSAIFGHVVEGFDTLEKINSAFIDSNGRPLKDIRIRHTIILEEAEIPDPKGLVVPPESPVPSAAQLATVRIADDEVLDEETDPEALERVRREREAKQQALTLEMIGDLPFAEVAPPENVLFVCKLNPVTRDEDLQLLFSRFGKILSCEVIRDKKTGDSLQYAFVEFAEKRAAEMAYAKMDKVLVDDHRLHVDFSQSVSRLADSWRTSANEKRARGGGFGGVENLEKRRQYRAEERPRERGYNMVMDSNARRKDVERRRSRSRSPREGHFDGEAQWDFNWSHGGIESRREYRANFRDRPDNERSRYQSSRPQ